MPATTIQILSAAMLCGVQTGRSQINATVRTVSPDAEKPLRAQHLSPARAHDGLSDPDRPLEQKLHLVCFSKLSSLVEGGCCDL